MRNFDASAQLVFTETDIQVAPVPSPNALPLIILDRHSPAHAQDGAVRQKKFPYLEYVQGRRLAVLALEVRA